MTISPNAASVWRDGAPTNPTQPLKSDIRAWGKAIEDVLDAFMTNGGLIYATRALLFADLSPSANRQAWVISDPTAAYNGIYQKQGSTGAGSWTRIGDLPYSFVRATDVGAGTPNAIQATSQIPVSASTLVIMSVFDTTTGTPVTVQFNGGPVYTIKTASGGDPVSGALTSNMIIAGFLSDVDSTFRMITDQSSAAIQAAAAASATAAQAAAAAAASIASAVLDPVFANQAAALAYSPSIAPDYLRIAGYVAAGDGGGALYHKVASQPAHAGKFSITLSGGTVVWYELAEFTRAGPQMLGAVGTKADGTADARAELAATDVYCQAKGVPIYLSANHRISSDLQISSPVESLGGKFTIDSGKKLTLFGGLVGPDIQVFKYADRTSRAYVNNEAVKATWWGVSLAWNYVSSPPAPVKKNNQVELQYALDSDQGKEAFNAQLAGVRARTVAQRVAAARQAASAQHPNESADQRNQRVEQAGLLAQAQAEQQLRDAQRERKIGLDQILTDQQLEISLVGKTAGETAALRKEYELTSQLRLEAAKNGTEVDQKELDLIKKRSEELGKLADAYAKAKLNDDLSFERDQIFRSADDQQIASRQRSAGQAVDLQSPEAQIMRQNLQASAIKDGVTGFISDFRQQLVSNGGKVGDAFGTALRNAALNALTKIGDEAANTLGNLFVKMLTGTSPGGAGVATASTGGLLGTLFGGGSKSSGLQAANSNVAATGTSSIAGGAVDKAMSLLGTNEKTGTGDINAFLKAGGVDINAAQTAWCAGFVNSSLAQIGIKGSGSQVATSFLDWGSKVDPSQTLKGDVLVQGRGLSAGEEGGHVGLATGASRVVDGQQQLQMLSGNSANSVQTTWVNAMNVQARRATDAANSLTKLAGSTGQASQGLTQLGQSLSSSFFPSAPAKSGGGLGGWLGSLFMPNFNPIGAQATKAASGSITGLFANGTDFSPGGVAMVGENGPELVNLPRGSQVVPNHKTEAMLRNAANTNDGGSAASSSPGVLHVHIDGANGDDHVQKLVEQGVQKGLFSYNENMRRQGVGTLNARYSAQKG